MYCTNLCKNYPFPHNVHHIHSNLFSGPRLHSRQWGRTSQSYVCSGTDQKQWHSIWCHLHTGGHHRALCQVRTDKPQTLLWHLATELVVLFHSKGEMLVTAHGVIKATALCNEPIWLCTSPPSITHVRAYVVVSDGKPSGTQCLTTERDEVPQPSPSNPHPDGGIPHQFQMDLGTLGMPR